MVTGAGRADPGEPRAGTRASVRVFTAPSFPIPGRRAQPLCTHGWGAAQVVCRPGGCYAAQKGRACDTCVSLEGAVSRGQGRHCVIPRPGFLTVTCRRTDGRTEGSRAVAGGSAGWGGSAQGGIANKPEFLCGKTESAGNGLHNETPRGGHGTFPVPDTWGQLVNTCPRARARGRAPFPGLGPAWGAPREPLPSSVAGGPSLRRVRTAGWDTDTGPVARNWALWRPMWK